jgi:hypothetical protein
MSHESFPLISIIVAVFNGKGALLQSNAGGSHAGCLPTLRTGGS